MKKVQVIPATLRSYTKKPMNSQKREGWQAMHGFQRITMSNLLAMKHRWIIIRVISRAEMIGNLSGYTRMKAFQLRIPNTGKDLSE